MYIKSLVAIWTDNMKTDNSSILKRDRCRKIAYGLKLRNLVKENTYFALLTYINVMVNLVL